MNWTEQGLFTVVDFSASRLGSMLGLVSSLAVAETLAERIKSHRTPTERKEMLLSDMQKARTPQPPGSAIDGEFGSLTCPVYVSYTCDPFVMGTHKANARL